MAKKNAGSEAYLQKLGWYEKAISCHPAIERKGKTLPYTSVNGHMFSFMDAEGF